MTLRDFLTTLWSYLQTFSLWLWGQPTWVAIMIVVAIIVAFWWLASLVGNR